MKKLITALSLSTMIMATSAMAEQSISTTVDIQNTAELNNVFDTTKIENLQVLELKNKEMKDTQGAFVPFIPVAIAVGSRFITSQVVKHYVGSASIAYGTYRASEQMSRR